ncbi:hypothetical protein D3C78_1349840 [compost metagenome]
MLGIVKVSLQRAKQCGSAFTGAGLLDATAEQVQLPSTGHGPVALHGQRLLLRVERFVRQGQRCVPARTLPERHDALGKVRLGLFEQGGQFGLGSTKVGHGEKSSQSRRLRAW